MVLISWVSTVYYKGTPASQRELDCKAIIDKLHMDNPACGARQMSSQLKLRGHNVGRRKARHYMTEMRIEPIYPKINLSKRMQQAKICPYLLRNAVIDRSNQARAITEEEVLTMINEQTCETLQKMKLNAIADELTHQLEDQTAYGSLGFEERLGLMVDASGIIRSVRNNRSTL